MFSINTELFSPVIKHGITKAPKNSYEYHEWWKEEVRRCNFGYSVGGIKITGRHYWYLNWWRIRGVPKGGGAKRIIPPRFLDTDFEFFWEFEHCVTNGQHMMVAKRRQVGATEKVAALIGHEFTFKPASQSVIVAGEEKYSINALKFVFRGLNQLAGTEFYQQRGPGDDGGYVARYKGEEPNGKGFVWKGRFSEIHALTAKNNPQVVSSKSPSLILFEECGVFKQLMKTYGYVAPSLVDQGKTVGTAIFLGTGGEMDDGTEDFGKMFYNPELHNIRSYENEYAEEENSKRIAYFIPGWKYWKIDDNGNSLKEESIAAIDKERDDAMAANDSQKLLELTIARPKTPDEIFLIVKQNRFPQAKLNYQRSRLLKYRELSAKHERISIEFLYDKQPVQGRPLGSIIGIEWELDKNGVFNIFEFPDMGADKKPRKGNFGGTDSYDKDKAPTSNSKGSTTIFNGYKMQYMARVTERPEIAEMFYEMTAKLCLMYGCNNLIEYSNIRIFDWYEKMGLIHLLKERPDIATANMINSTVDNKYGVDPNSKNTWLNMYSDYMKIHHEKMYDIEQVSKALLWKEDKDYNCDITISSSLAYLHYADEMIYLPTEAEGMSPPKRAEFLYFTSKGGKLSNNFVRN